jgi:hypothetical protein
METRFVSVSNRTAVHCSLAMTHIPLIPPPPGIPASAMPHPPRISQEPDSLPLLLGDEFASGFHGIGAHVEQSVEGCVSAGENGERNQLRALLLKGWGRESSGGGKTSNDEWRRERSASFSREGGEVNKGGSSRL